MSAMFANVDRTAAAVAGATSVVAWLVTKAVTVDWAIRSQPLVYEAPLPFTIGALLMRHMVNRFIEKSFGEKSLADARVAEKEGKVAMYINGAWFTRFIQPLEPQDAMYIMLGNPTNYVKHEAIYRVVGKYLLGDHGLVTITNEDYHTIQRRNVNPAFSPTALRQMTEGVITKHIALLLKHFVSVAGTAAAPINGSKALDMSEEYDHLALDIIAEAAFKETSVDDTNVSDLFREVTHVMQQNPMVLLPVAILPGQASARRRLFELRNKILSVSTALAERRKEQGGAAVEEVTSAKLIVDYLLENPEITNDMLSSHALTFLLAGHETTANVLTWASALLAVHPAVQQELFEELAAVMPRGAVPDLDSIAECSLLSGVINEALRLYPPAPGLLRTTVKDDVWPSGLVVPAGTDVQLPIFWIQRSKKAWGPDADEFRPQRWEDREVQKIAAEGAFFPFLLGKRHCIGKDMALTELRLTLAAVVRNFELVAEPGATMPKRRSGITVKCETPLPTTLKARSS